jgi:hypothetical protein
LPDGFFSDQKYQFGYILEDLGMENVATFAGHLEYFTKIWWKLWAFGNSVVMWYIFPQLWYIVPKKSGNPDVTM